MKKMRMSSMPLDIGKQAVSHKKKKKPSCIQDNYNQVRSFSSLRNCLAKQEQETFT
jgi:hypothetical protein